MFRGEPVTLLSPRHTKTWILKAVASGDVHALLNTLPATPGEKKKTNKQMRLKKSMRLTALASKPSG